jgi:uncharacterized protein (TIGR02452 family)
MSLTGLAKSTLAICESGTYTAPSGRVHDLARAVVDAKAGTRLYRPGDFAALRYTLPYGDGPPPRIELTGETTTQAARRLVQDEGESRVVALNFASAKNPGGGFLGGAKAQEEDLCRASALYVCQLEQPDYYAENRACGTMVYTDHLVYSPDVPVFREGRDLLEDPYLLSFLTSPAPNAGEARRHGESARSVRDALYRRAGQVLAVAASEGHRTLVLGAWGCGVFRNDPAQVADAFATALAGLPGAFDRVVFAVWERDPSVGNFAAFEARFGAASAG